MSKPHVHAEVIKAWADGKQVQTYIGWQWVDLTVDYPTWENEQYRVKPETIRYRVALVVGNHALTTTSPNKAEEFEKSPVFIRWLTDWVEVEI